MSEYENQLALGFWDYVRANPTLAPTLEKSARSGRRPPVFQKEFATRNVLVCNAASQTKSEEVFAALPKSQWHKWYRSMASSQALAQSVFANVRAMGGYGVLEGILADCGEPLIGRTISGLELEHPVRHLGERAGHQTSVDVLISAELGYRVAIECKLRESEVGACSRPDTKRTIDVPGVGLQQNPQFERDHCDGSYSVQCGRVARCALTEVGVKYWDHIPRLFRWPAGVDHAPCPVRYTYQLMRNLLAVCVDPITCEVNLEAGHAVLIYDSRNPAFAAGGRGDVAFTQLSDALVDRRLLRRCSWQVIAQHLRASTEFCDLGKMLFQKYGL